ncbi:MAG: BlaI/MecI/CopY family transcriptional regulator [Gemmatimonadaceae bacterium]
MTDATLGDRELDVMAVLWEIGSGSVGDVRDRLPAHLAYTTVLTILRNLEAKQFVTREADGRGHRYTPRVPQRAARKSAVRRLVDKLFAGSPEQLLAQLVDDRALGADDLRRLARRAAARPPIRRRGAK